MNLRHNSKKCEWEKTRNKNAAQFSMGRKCGKSAMESQNNVQRESIANSLRLYELHVAAGQSPTLARPAAPLAACVQRFSYVDKTNKYWLPWHVR